MIDKLLHEEGECLWTKGLPFNVWWSELKCANTISLVHLRKELALINEQLGAKVLECCLLLQLYNYPLPHGL